MGEKVFHPKCGSVALNIFKHITPVPVIKSIIYKSISPLPAWVIANTCFYSLILSSITKGGSRDKINLLALNPNRFRGELEILVSSKKFSITRMSFKWQCFLYAHFYDILKNEYNPLTSQIEDHKTKRNKHKYKKIVRILLLKLQKKYQIRAVIAAAIHYRQDYEFLAIAKKIGIPAIIMQRESNVSSLYMQNFFVERLRKYNQFHGTHILFHNHIQRDLFVQTGYISHSQGYVTGIPRMDDYVHTHRNNSYDIRSKVITLFSFGPMTGILESSPPHWPKNPKDYLYNFCKETHKAIYELAAENPDWTFIIKPKWGGRWTENIRKIVNVKQQNTPKNLLIDAEHNVHDLITKSRIVAGFNSTTLLEAGLLCPTVIIPIFAEAKDPKWEKCISFKDESSTYQIAASKLEFKQQILNAMNNDYKLTKSVSANRFHVFNKYTYAADGCATDRLIETLSELTI
ncbi:hypothetical protein [Kiloniella sp. EL199]|uniref:hypothetical protein n=1 Tax=Kiloniella sp. EL199 TaxID=2107581 RepID=UPI000EA0F4F2|nr:hypothetical protein [Kiloniella sp. EL199]